MSTDKLHDSTWARQKGLLPRTLVMWLQWAPLGASSLAPWQSHIALWCFFGVADVCAWPPHGGLTCCSAIHLGSAARWNRDKELKAWFQTVRAARQLLGMIQGTTCFSNHSWQYHWGCTRFNYLHGHPTLSQTVMPPCLSPYITFWERQHIL